MENDFLRNHINKLFFGMEVQYIYCKVLNQFLNITQINMRLETDNCKIIVCFRTTSNYV